MCRRVDDRAPLRAPGLDVGRPLPAVDLGAADYWAVVLTYAGRPIEHVWLPSPGAAEDPRRPPGRPVRPRRRPGRGRGQLRERLCAPAGRERDAVPAAVVLGGRLHPRPPEFLDGLLRSLAHLDPAAKRGRGRRQRPGRRDCRASSGGGLPLRARGPQGPRPRPPAGAGRCARRARGVHRRRLRAGALARGPPRAVLDRSVAAVTGPGFAYELETPPQLRSRRSGFSRGLRTRASDLLGLDPATPASSARAPTWCSGAASAGAGRPVPGELDAGTPTRSGRRPDRARAHARGRPPRRLRPAAVRPAPPPARRALAARHVRGYGVGLTRACSSCSSRTASWRRPVGWSWLVRQYLGRAQDRARGRATRSTCGSGGTTSRRLAAPAALVRARRATGLRAVPRRGAGRSAAPRVAGQHGAAASRPPRAPRGAAAGRTGVSVVIPTRARPGALARCLRASPPGRGRRVEVVVVDDDEPAAPTPDRDADSRCGSCAAAGRRRRRPQRRRPRARGRILLFLDDDLVPAPDLVAAPSGGGTTTPRPRVVGLSTARPTARHAGGAAAALWWHEHFARKRTGHRADLRRRPHRQHVAPRARRSQRSAASTRSWAGCAARTGSGAPGAGRAGST